MARSKLRKVKPLTLAQAWSVLAVLYQHRAGFCLAIDDLTQRGLLSEKTGEKMHEPIRRAVRRARRGDGYMADRQVSCYDSIRIAFAERQVRKARRG